jgi:hypothetical protein
MKVDLPSGGWVELREKLMAQDKFAVQAAVKVELDTATGFQHTAVGLVNDMRNQLLVLLIDGWSFTAVIPKDNHAGARILGEILDLDDYNCLSEAVEPMLLRVVTGGAPNRPAPSAS